MSEITVLLDFVGDKKVHAKISDTILNSSLKAGINHIFECGGNARCSTGIYHALNELNYYLKQNFNVEIKTGTGIHYGTVITGQIGCKRKKDFTALGDVVKKTSRIENFTKKVGVQILISEQVEKSCDKNNFQTGSVFESALKGKKGTHKLYELLSRCNPSPTGISLNKENIMSDFKKYRCRECEYLYDEEKDNPNSGIPAGIRWEDIPDDWVCPICGAPKSFFRLED